MVYKRGLFIVDPQNDFCEKEGALYVPGADMDIERLSSLICEKGEKIDAIWVSLDSHSAVHIAHSGFWMDVCGNGPGEYVRIKLEDVDSESPKWVPRNEVHYDKAVNYLRRLEEGGRYELIIWPEHCLVGAWGHMIHKNLSKVLYQWEREKVSAVKYVFKGLNIFTEHYSAIQAAVSVEGDLSTGYNHGLVDELMECEHLYVAGEARSHCLGNTLCDLPRELMERVVLLSDGTSDVVGFEEEGEAFIKKLGVKESEMAELDF